MDGGLILTAPFLPRFLLDSNVLMEANKRYYAFAICPGFWDSLTALSSQGKVMSIDRVLAEIQEQKDELRRWAGNGAPAALFVSSAEDAVADAYQRVIGWVHAHPRFTLAAKRDFARKADGWLVAYGLVHRLTVVTDEVLDPNIKRRVPIPNVCEQFRVARIGTFGMLRALQVKFDWRGP